MFDFKHIKRIYTILIMLIVTMLVTSCSSQGVTSYIEKQEELTSKAPVEQDFTADTEDGDATDIPDGEYSIDISLSGGTGKASIKSPATMVVSGGEQIISLEWSSKNYDYMIVDGTKYLNEATEGNSLFHIPVSSIDEPIEVIADTTAMSTPHEIEYVITCSMSEDSKSLNDVATNDTSAYADRNAKVSAFPETLLGMEKGDELSLDYANQFAVAQYGDYKLINIAGEGSYLLVPEDKLIPADIDKDITILKQPFDSTYLVSSSVMSLLIEAGALDKVKLSGTKREDWYIQDAIDAMDARKIIYAGKYSAPDYELLLANGCNLAIENTMLYHKPEVKEKLEELGIPVLIERSSYENHPLGRVEWVKLYGILYDNLEQTEQYYVNQIEALKSLESTANTGKKIAFFYVTSNGSVNVRRVNDYIPKMIDMAGGIYVPKMPEDDSTATSTLNMQVEDFYIEARDADILIYNSTINGVIESIDELIKVNQIFSDFTAVKSGNVYCTSKNFFQETTAAAQFITELNMILNGIDGEYIYLNKLK